MWRRSRNTNRDAATQVYEEDWYAVGHHDLHECCDCGLVHRVTYRFERGRLLERWQRDPKATARARRAITPQ